MRINRHQGAAKGRNRVVEHRGIVYAAGTAPGADIREQTRNTLDYLEKSLQMAGSGKTLLLRAQIYLVDMAEKDAMDEVWNEWIGPDWRRWPQRACVGAPLAGDNRVEIVLTAATREDASE